MTQEPGQTQESGQTEEPRQSQEPGQTRRPGQTRIQIEASRSPVVERGQERQVTVQLGRSFGFDLRPSRFFIWPGPEREGRERIVSLGRPPSRMMAPRRRRFLSVGPAEISYLGSPAVTVPLSVWRYVQHVRRVAGKKQVTSGRK